MTRRAALAAAALVALAVVCAAVGGPPRLLVTQGQSMEPGISAGDLAVLRPTGSSAVGDVVAYRSGSLGGTVVLHRVVAVATDGALTTQGDNNDWLDRDHPTRDDVLGTLLLRVPQGGVWLRRATEPVVLGLVTFALVCAGSAAAATRRSRRRRTAVTAPHARGPALRALSPAQRTAGGAAVCAGVLGVALLAASTGSGTAARLVAEDRSMTFDYSAAVRPNDVYEGARAEAPLPVWRRLGEWVQVAMTYEGRPGTVRVDARLSMPNGWSRTVPLRPAEPVAGGEQRVVALDLSDLDRRMRTVSAQTGVEASSMRVEVVPTVVADGSTWSPVLAFDLAPLALTLSDGPEALVVSEAGAPAVAAARDGLRLLGLHLPAELLRTLALLLLAGAAALGSGVLVRVRTGAPTDQAEAIRRRWSDLLVPVEPVTAAPGRQVVDVPEFATLARLAERYGLLVLHWERSGVATFVVQDESVTYRFRTGEADAAPADALPEGALPEGAEPAAPPVEVLLPRQR